MPSRKDEEAAKKTPKKTQKTKKTLCTATSSIQKAFPSFFASSLFSFSFFLHLSPFLSSLCSLGTDIHFLCLQAGAEASTESPDARCFWIQTVQLRSTVRDSLGEVSCEYLTASWLCKICCHSANQLKTPYSRRLSSWTLPEILAEES